MKNKILSVTLLLSSFLMVGCVQQPPSKIVKVVEKPKPKTSQSGSKAPKKNIKLKEVEDENFSSEYMYPDAKKKETAKIKEPESTVAADINPVVTSMSNSECIAMIGQEKFNKYSQMYGGSAGALKKCKMLKAL